MSNERRVSLFDNSRISSFKVCPRMYLFEHVYHWRPEEKSVALTFGTAWHAAQDAIWRSASALKTADKSARRAIVDTAYDAFVTAWTADGLPHPDELSPDDLEQFAPRTPQIAREMFHGYLDAREHIFSDPSFAVLAIEQPFAVPLSPDDPTLFYVGRLDKIFEYRKQVLVGEHKCLARGTLVIRHDGTTISVEEVKLGDLLMGPDSLPRKVSRLYSGVDQLYTVTPSQGAPYTVNSAHILSLKNKNNKIINLPVTDFIEKAKGFRAAHKGWRAAVDFPIKQTLSRYPHADLPPYLLGVWLGDGNANNQGICLGPTKGEVLRELERYAAQRGMSITAQGKGKTAPVYNATFGRQTSGRNPLLEALRAFNLIGNKHIPQVYKTLSRTDRLELLAGFIDTDGSLQQNGGGGYRVSQKSLQVVEDIAFIARSLGFGVTYYLRKSKCMTKGYEKTGDYWWLYIYGQTHEIPCRVASKKAPKKSNRVDPLQTTITISQAGVGSYFGFELEGPDHLFLLGDFTVTHNTTTAYKKGGPFRSDFIDGFAVSAQIDGYVYALKHQYRERAAGVWIDAALVHKTEHAGFKFLPESRSDEHLDSWLWETHHWIDSIQGNIAALRERAADSTEYLDAFPRNTNSCLQYGRCKFLDICRVVANPAKLDGPPMGYKIDPWSPFDVMKLEKLGFKVENTTEPLKGEQP